MNDTSQDWEDVDACPLCGATERTAYPVRMPGETLVIQMEDIDFPVTFAVQYNQCLCCGMIYQNPRFTDDARDKFYSSGVYRDLTSQSKDDNEAARGKRLAKLIEPLGVESVLDIGCGRGEFLKACRDMGAEDVMGVDSNPEYASGDIMVRKQTWPEMVPFHLVSMIHMLEHTVDPVAELKKARGHSNRYVLVEVPSIEHGGWAMYLPHTLIFKSWTLVNAFERAGLQVTGLGVTADGITVIGERA